MHLDQAMLGLELFDSLNGVIDEAKAAGLAASELGAEAKHGDALNVADVVHLGNLLLQLSLPRKAGYIMVHLMRAVVEGRIPVYHLDLKGRRDQNWGCSAPGRGGSRDRWRSVTGIGMEWPWRGDSTLETFARPGCRTSTTWAAAEKKQVRNNGSCEHVTEHLGLLKVTWIS